MPKTHYTEQMVDLGGSTGLVPLDLAQELTQLSYDELKDYIIKVEVPLVTPAEPTDDEIEASAGLR